MAATSFQVEVGYGLGESVLVTGTVDTTPPGLSGLYIKLFAPVDTPTGNPLLVSLPATISSGPLRVERRYELPHGAPLRVEVDATAGSSGVPILFTARTNDGRTADGTGLTNETIAVELPAASAAH